MLSPFCREHYTLVQQVQMLGSGALGGKAARIVRQVAAQNGVWSLGNFGGEPPPTSMTLSQPDSSSNGDGTDVDSEEMADESGISDADYRALFQCSAVGMVRSLRSVLSVRSPILISLQFR